MDENTNLPEQIKAVYRSLFAFLIAFCIIAIGLITYIKNPNLFNNDSKSAETESEYVAIPQDDDFDKIENGIHVRTGFVEAEGLMETVNNCTNCHSSELVLQNRMSKERWIATIRWMQETQNLWDLGGNEAIIVDYLVTNYPVIAKGRRSALTDIQWYELED
ncbi:monoheme cytochrome C [Maribacter algarum]|uniref:Monoheme cytochrome C n=1 Tax=Maribacter algarum (ex Zhang et al. 2020) TaxID=2578118 RepID=A0A5S3PS68_9FLAO|nr:monoheme cytochrome C [Maribacter algarum]TMM57479.1 monoheme cytochrome C [Maribacter algarum]